MRDGRRRLPGISPAAEQMRPQIRRRTQSTQRDRYDRRHLPGDSPRRGRSVRSAACGQCCRSIANGRLLHGQRPRRRLQWRRGRAGDRRLRGGLRRNGPRRRRFGLGQLRPQRSIIGRLLLGLEQAHARRRQLVQQFLRQGRMRPGLKGPNVGHLPVGRVGDRIGVRFEQFDRQQPIVIRRLMFRRNAEPLAVGIERFGHSGAGSRKPPGSVD